MNGDAEKIYNAITDVRIKLTEVMTKQQENHAMNKGSIDVIFKKINDLNEKIVCHEVKSDVEALDKDMKRVYKILGAVAIVILGALVGVYFK